MEKVPIDQLTEGMLVGQSIYSEQGRVLLAQGTPLTSSYIAALVHRGFLAIYIQDGMGDDVLPPEALSHEVRHAVRKHMLGLFKPPSDGREGKRGGAIANLRPETPQMAVIYKDVSKIVQEVMNSESISGVVSIKSHDNYTFEHSVEVTITGVLIGKQLNLPLRDLHQLALGCLCHDVGKVAIPPETLNKPGKLTPEEFDLVKEHPGYGYDAARKFMKEDDIIARSVIWQHHERQDGSGYPNGLMGNNVFDYYGPRRYGEKLIVPAAEIAAVADVYSALASDRPYRPAMEPPAIARVMREMAGSHLNMELVRRFLSILPIYSVGSKVVVTAGRLKGYIGVVTDQNPKLVDRPMVRMVADPTGRLISPVDVDTSKEDGIELGTASAAVGAPLGR